MASRFWVGGTGTWDASDTSHWAATTGGASGASVPGTADTVTFDGSSGGGTCTVNTDVAVLSMNLGAYTGTLDFSVNNNNVTLSNNTTIAFNDSGSGTHTLNMGNGTWTVSGTVSATTTFWSTANTNLTLNANGSTLRFTGVGGDRRNLQLGNKTYNAISFESQGDYGVASGSGTPTITTLTLGPGAKHTMGSIVWNVTTLVTTSTLAAPAAIIGVSGGSTIGGNGTYSVSNIAFNNMVLSGANTRTATNCFDLGGNSGITMSPPSGATAGMIGS